MKDEDIGKEFVLKGLTDKWIYYGIEKNRNNDYGLSSKDYPFRYYFYRYCEGDKKTYQKIDDLSKIIRLEDNKKNIMNTIKNTLKDLMRTEPEKTFIKAGFIDSEENITTKGREALEYILWNNNKDEIKKLADKIIEKDADR